MNILIWGTGEYSRLVFEHVKFINGMFGVSIYTINGYIDNDARMNTCNGIKVYHPQNIETEHDPIVIGVYEDRAIISQIKEEIGGEFYTFFDFVYRDYPIEKLMGKILVDNEDIFSRKIMLQQLVDKFNRNEITSDVFSGKYRLEEIIAAEFCIFSKNIGDALPVIEKIGIKKEANKNKRVKNIGLYYSRYANGGVERVLSHLIEMFVEKGYRVILFTDECQETGEYDLPQEAIRVVLNGKLQGFVYQWLIEFAAYILEYKLDILISHQSYWEGNYYLGYIAGMYGCRFITEIHNNFSGFAFQNMSFFKTLYQNIEKVVCLSETDKTFWKLCGVDCSYIPNPVRIKKFEEYSRKQCEGNNVLWIGRLEQKQKNILDVLQVAYLVKKRIPSVKFHVVGSFSDRIIKDKFVKAREELDLLDTVILCGYHTQVLQFYFENDLMILTSNYEGFPMTIAEAMVCGCPIVSYELPYLEMFRVDKGVITVPTRDIEKMAYEVEELLLDTEKRNCMSREAREVIELFSDRSIIDKWEELFYENIKPSESSTRNWLEKEKDYINIIELLLDRVSR